jgi:hypothetical protein
MACNRDIITFTVFIERLRSFGCHVRVVSILLVMVKSEVDGDRNDLDEIHQSLVWDVTSHFWKAKARHCICLAGNSVLRFNEVRSINANHHTTYNRWVKHWISIVRGGVQLGPLGIAATNRPIVPAMGDCDDGEVGGIIGRGNRSTRRKPVPVLFCPHKPYMLPGREPGQPKWEATARKGWVRLYDNGDNVPVNKHIFLSCFKYQTKLSLWSHYKANFIWSCFQCTTEITTQTLNMIYELCIFSYHTQEDSKCFVFEHLT